MSAIPTLRSIDTDRRTVDGRLLAAGRRPPVDFHVGCDRDGRWLVSRQGETIGRYYSEASALALACWCAVEECEQGQAARVHRSDGAGWTLAFVTIDPTYAELFG